MSERLTKEEVELAADERFGLTTPMMVRLARELLEARQQLAAAPAWHDRPTGPGNWACRWGTAGEYTKVFERDGRLHMLSRLEPCDEYPHCKWYGPIPEPE